MKELGNTPADKNYKPSGISRAQAAAFMAFPGQPFIHDRCVFRMGYEQAEKDLELTWEDIKEIQRLLDVVWSEQEITAPIDEDSSIYPEVLKRFKEIKED